MILTSKKSQESDLKLLQKAYHDYGQEVIFPNLRERAEMLDNMDADPVLAAMYAAKALKDIEFFFDYFLWTHDPRPQTLKWYGLKNATVPFILYPKQREIVKRICGAIDGARDILLDKSRDQGASWMLFGGIFLWYWLQGESGNDFLFGSRKFESVDKKGSGDTLFEKFRYNLYRLPSVFLPSKFDASKHDNVGFIVNPDTGNFVKGEANNANFGTGGRYKASGMDEYAKWEDTDKKAWTSMGSATQCRIPVSTPFGMGRWFSKLRFGGKIDVLQLHWSDNPLHGFMKRKVEQHPYLAHKKNVFVSPWYLRECERRSENSQADIGQELDMDHLTSGLPYFSQQMYMITDKVKELEESTFEYRKYDFNRIDKNELELEETSLGRLLILEDVESGWEYRYIISADVAEGLEHGDNSTLVIYDRVKGQDIGWFAGQVDTHVFALLLEHLGFLYDEAYIAVETNNHGHHVNQVLKQSYENLYHRQDFTRVVDMDRLQIGWLTTVQTKPLMCGKLRQAIDDGSEVTKNIDFWRECATFMRDGKTGKLGAEEGSKDDRVIAQAIKWMLHEWLPAPKKVEKVEDVKYGNPRFGGVDVGRKDGDIRQIWT